MAKKACKKSAKRAVCRATSCRKKPVEGSDLCRDHQNPMDAVTKLTEVELLKLAKFNSDLQLALLNTKLATLDMQTLQRVADAEMNRIREKMLEDVGRKDEERKGFIAESKALKSSYDAFTEVIATKYGIADPGKMVVDPDTGVIRDLSNL